MCTFCAYLYVRDVCVDVLICGGDCGLFEFVYAPSIVFKQSLRGSPRNTFTRLASECMARKLSTSCSASVGGRSTGTRRLCGHVWVWLLLFGRCMEGWESVFVPFSRSLPVFGWNTVVVVRTFEQLFLKRE